MFRHWGTRAAAIISSVGHPTDGHAGISDGLAFLHALRLHGGGSLADDARSAFWPRGRWAP